jgi:DNA-binding NtrC family response regulator
MTAAKELLSYLDGLADPHIVFDTDYNIVGANRAYRKAFADGKPIVGRKCYEVSHHIHVPCDQAGETCPLAQSRASGQVERVLHLHHTPKGEEYFQIELTPLTDVLGQQNFYVEKMAPMALAATEPAAKGMVGRSAAFQHMLNLVARVAPSDASVLLLGESGTGKELVAHAIHQASPRANKPFVVVDCASLTESLFESELFGHERGAFTGANQAKPGLVESANGGTLFLDEVGDIPLAMQVKLLRLLETGTHRRVGSTELRHTDVRVVAATHRHLAAWVAQGKFREDLYYRLCVFPIALPALRERKGDMALLAPALLERVSRQRPLKLSKAALKRMEKQEFAGNIRELRNVLERAALLCDGAEIDVQHIELALATGLVEPSQPSLKAKAQPHSSSLKQASLEQLKEMVKYHHGSKSELAALLGISERTLYRKLQAARTAG